MCNDHSPRATRGGGARAAAYGGLEHGPDFLPRGACCAAPCCRSPAPGPDDVAMALRAVHVNRVQPRGVAAIVSREVQHEAAGGLGHPTSEARAKPQFRMLVDSVLLQRGFHPPQPFYHLLRGGIRGGALAGAALAGQVRAGGCHGPLSFWLIPVGNGGRDQVRDCVDGVGVPGSASGPVPAGAIRLHGLRVQPDGSIQVRDSPPRRRAPRLAQVF